MTCKYDHEISLKADEIRLIFEVLVRESTTDDELKREIILSALYKLKETGV